MDENCVDCDETISIYYSIMDLYHITLSNLTFINNSSDEWCSFVTTYDVQYLPTLILSPDVKYYKELNNDWKDYFGSIEEDGSLVHRSFGISVNTVSNISSCLDV